MRIRKVIAAIRGLSPKLAGYRILHISDIHFDDKTKSNEVLWQLLHSGAADIILITGDFVTQESNIDSVVAYLKNSKASDGVFGVLGNHDYYFLSIMQHVRHRVMKRPYIPNDWKRLVAELSGIGIKILINESANIRTSNGSSLFIEGTDDPVRGNPEIRDRDSAYELSELKILLSHSPDILYSDHLKKKRFDMLLSGHTHGGQIRVPGIGAVLTGTKYAKRSESYGVYRTSDDMFVNVSSGIGYSLLPLRINCPPEVTLIALEG
ncbi:MAG TPA: metallophosphoesterase [Nitrososphaera sp.]|nr:metallophosphoesterase [Nitrososphaera sp.]